MQKACREYHDKTPDLAERLGKDIAAALRLGLTDITVTSVAAKLVSYEELPERATHWPADVKVRYYFEAQFPGVRSEVGAA